MRKETREFLSARHTPEEIYSDYHQKFLSWRENIENKEYTHPKTVFVNRGGMALGAAAANGIAYKMSEMGITFPLVVPMGYNPVEIQVFMTNFNMEHLKHDSVFEIYKSKSFYNVKNLMRHYLRFAPNANQELMENHTNIAFLTTKMPSREAHLYSEGKLINGILASGAFPLAFPPIENQIDGDMSYKLPIQQIEDHLGFRPEEIIYAKLDKRSRTVEIARNVLGIITRTPGVRELSDWAEGIPVRELLIQPGIEVIKDMSSTDYHKQEQMDHIFEVASLATQEFFE